VIKLDFQTVVTPRKQFPPKPNRKKERKQERKKERKKDRPVHAHRLWKPQLNSNHLVPGPKRLSWTVAYLLLVVDPWVKVYNVCGPVADLHIRAIKSQQARLPNSDFQQGVVSSQDLLHLPRQISNSSLLYSLVTHSDGVNSYTWPANGVPSINNLFIMPSNDGVNEFEPRITWRLQLKERSENTWVDWIDTQRRTECIVILCVALGGHVLLSRCSRACGQLCRVVWAKICGNDRFADLSTIQPADKSGLPCEAR